MEVNANVVANNRKLLSIIGSNLGTQYFKAEARASWPNFEKSKIEIEQGGNVEFILNRTPRRYRLTGHDIVSTIVAQDPTGTAKVYINKDTDSEISIPIVPGAEKIGNVQDDALGKALRGDKSIFFSDAKKLAAQLNVYNNDEKTRLVALRQFIDKCITQIDSSIAENNKKADQILRELTESTPSDVPTADNTVVVLE